ncbi:Alpha/Beta hydrolase fold [Sesbania bispinosa]|nr:Alpha/Beta hydrolase fold [Sesbania bispinosa]
MEPTNPEISVEVPPYLRVHKDGTIERLAGTQVVPAGFDSETNVVSKDIVIIPETGVTARLYCPNFTPKNVKLPLVLYFHGGAYCIASPSEPLYHNSLNKLVAEANVVAVSVNYRVFLAGDSAGANIGHYMAVRLHVLSSGQFKVPGLIMVHPYFWGKEPIGVEITDPERKKMVDKWWDFVCPSDKGNDDPLINPFVEEAPDLKGVGCNKVLVTIAEKDILRERGKLYHKKLVNSGWKGTAEFYETRGEDHVFHIFNPNSDKAKSLIKRIAAFINEQ